MKVSYSEVRRLKNTIKNEPVLLAAQQQGKQPSTETLGYFTPSQANWSYQVGLTRINGNLYKVVTQFGQIVGGEQLFVQDNVVIY